MIERVDDYLRRNFPAQHQYLTMDMSGYVLNRSEVQVIATPIEGAKVASWKGDIDGTYRHLMVVGPAAEIEEWRRKADRLKDIKREMLGLYRELNLEQ